MARRTAFALLLLLVPAAAPAQEPEQLLPAGVQLYARWDGLKAHQAAYDKTAVGRMMQGDMGKFVQHGLAQLQETLGSLLTVQGLLEGSSPEQLQKLQADVQNATKLLGMLGDQGFVLAAEVRSATPPSGQITLIVPDAGAKAEPLFGSLRLLVALTKIPAEQKEVDGRKITVIDGGPVQAGWWLEGKHAVVILGTDKIEDAVKRMKEKENRLTDNPQYKKLMSVKTFETSARAFVDFASITKLASGVVPEAKTIIEGLGLDGLKSVRFLSGFEGEAERGLTEVETDGTRKGLLGLLGGKKFTLADAPPLPADVISWSMNTLELSKLYDVLVGAAETVVKVVSPDHVDQIKEFLKMADAAVGVDLRKDLLGSLGDRMVTYNSPSEGAFSLSQTYLFRVKDADKLQESLAQLIRGLAQVSGTKISVRKRDYRGVTLHEVHVAQEGFVFAPTYAIHDGWFILGYYPQPVQGYVLRAKGELPVWKPDAQVRKSLEMLPKEVTSLSVSDPRPSIKQLMSIAPLIGAAIRSFVPESKFDVGSIPHGEEVSRHLFPNVTVISDDGKTMQMHSRASFSLPFDVAGLDTYVLAFAAFGFAASFAP